MAGIGGDVLRAILLAAGAGVALPGCAGLSGPPLLLPAAVDVHVYASQGTPARDYPADSPVATRLKAWADAHRDGWSQCLTPPPIGALAVRAAGESLWFKGGTAVHADATGVYCHGADPADYAFLQP